MSRFRLGLLLGCVLGYYFGAKAGRERYLQLRRSIDRVRGNRIVNHVRTLATGALKR
ncbi:MAG: hypothetical protein ACRD1Z_15595 [Vicinamibacteria bacterium]